MNLTDAQRNDFIEEANEWLNGNIQKKSYTRSAVNEILRVDLGPTSQYTCTCCGR